jgi:hypothetical protein
MIASIVEFFAEGAAAWPAALQRRRRIWWESKVKSVIEACIVFQDLVKSSIVGGKDDAGLSAISVRASNTLWMSSRMGFAKAANSSSFFPTEKKGFVGSSKGRRALSRFFESRVWFL